MHRAIPLFYVECVFVRIGCFGPNSSLEYWLYRLISNLYVQKLII